MTKPAFSPMFRVKLETMLRILQAHGAALYYRFGQEVSQSAFDDLFKDALGALFVIRYDDYVEYGPSNTKEWDIFTSIITDEFNALHGQIQGLYDQCLPSVMVVNKYNLLLACTCDKVVDRLNMEAASIHA